MAWLDQTAGALNPLLTVVVVGLALLDATLYLGLAVAQQPYVWTAPMAAVGSAGSVAPPPHGSAPAIRGY